MTRVPALLALALLLASGHAVARADEARLTLPPETRLEGDVEVRAAWGILDLSRAASLAPLDVEWASAEGYAVTHVRHERARVAHLFSMNEEEPPENRTVSTGAGRLRNVTCHEPCLVAAFVPEPNAPGELAVSGRAAGALGFTPHPREFATHVGFDFERFDYVAGADWVVAATPGAPEPMGVLADGATARASGRVGIVLMNVTAELVTDEGVEPVRALYTREAEPGPGGATLSHRERDVFLVLHLEDARLSVGRGAALLAPAPTVHLDGRLSATTAEGDVRASGKRHALVGESLRLGGDLRVLLRGSGGPEVPSWAPARPGETLAHAHATGDITLLEIGGRAVVRPTAGAEVAAGVTLVAALAAALALAVKLGLHLALYTRIPPSRMLENANRRDVYDAIAARPGLSISQVARETGLREVVVRHHLTMLESARLARVVRSGHARVCYPGAHRLDAESLAAGELLRDGTRQRLAEALACAGGSATQADLAAATGLSQRLVSYHLVRLEKARLVLVEAGLPKRYRPVAALREALETRAATGDGPSDTASTG